MAFFNDQMPAQPVPRWNAHLELKFTKLEYHLELEFSELKYQKSGTLLISSKIVLDYQKFCQNVVFGYFHPWQWAKKKSSTTIFVQ